MYIGKDELTLDEGQQAHFAESLRWEDLAFQSKANRDAVARMAKQELGIETRKSSMPGQIIDPRYTVEGQHLPDKGLANDSICTTLYMLTQRVAT
jgi:hypothetical protein